MKGFKKPLLSLEKIYLRNSLYYRKESNCSFKYGLLGLVGPLGENVPFFVSLGLVDFLFILKLLFLKPSYNNLNYDSTANIGEVTKVYSLGDQSFETLNQVWLLRLAHLMM